ncbi:hypothetical protein AB1Y20_018786 [Prymnesium parvum]|uniref:Uncharacterized protein n=1 Tax=Prymnesium parvum TaxID=97485 RepID=A0AB34JSE3_PRYPA|eukprot:CAMPEP_0184378322 /NCGR_PEP_ID=MMETSP0007-20130409/2965_1 /TAXON_ID=97485 /ORGANISM="Prymnesium parvum, Strain Texoma1" /LENGTH=255 /DNA_ID=CAMNT_0026722547 /DNA_START=38 /DNA_END=805 /DNA_ORIENTATION=-
MTAMGALQASPTDHCTIEDYRTAMSTPWPRAKWRSSLELPAPGVTSQSDAVAKPVKMARWRANKSLPNPGKGTKGEPSRKWRTQTIFSPCVNPTLHEGEGDQCQPTSEQATTQLSQLAHLQQLHQLQQLQQLQHLRSLQQQFQQSGNAPLQVSGHLMSSMLTEATEQPSRSYTAPALMKPKPTIAKQTTCKSLRRSASDALGDAASALKMLSSREGAKKQAVHSYDDFDASNEAEAAMRPADALLALAAAVSEIS